MTEGEWRRWAATSSHTAFVLGAGFSRAISDQMPLTDELGTAALELLRGDLPPRLALAELPPGLNFEAWLSQLASDQPYLSDAQNAQNQAAFLQFSEAIAHILGERVNNVLASPYPEWLLTFVSAMHHARSTAVTFNYDPLVECMVATPTGILGDPNHYGEVWNGVDWTELSGGLPSWAPGSSRLAATPVDTFRLLKLHGSLNWYWRASDLSGVSVARRPLPGHFGAPQPYTDEERRRVVPGRTPFVVPPAASKSEYYANPITKEMWSQAAERLAEADMIVIAGYSLPATDTTFGNLLRDCTFNRDCRLVIANRSPEPVRARLTELGVDPDRIRVAASGDAAIPNLVEGWAASRSSDVLGSITDNRDDQDRLLLAWGDRTAYAPLEALEHADGHVSATATRVYGSLHLATGIDSRPAMSIAEAAPKLRAVQSNEDQGFQARVRTGSSQPIVGVEQAHIDSGQGTGSWIVLQVAGTPPKPDPT